MDTCRISLQNIGECVEKASEILHIGGVILYPTDTLYGLGVDALSDAAVAKVYALKGRDERKPIHCIVTNMDMVSEYAKVDDVERRLAARFLPGPLTLILKKREGIETGIARGIDTIGIRIPDYPFCLALAKKFGKPITTTSANRSGQKTGRNVKEILEQLSGGDAYASLLPARRSLGAGGQKTAIENIDLVIDAGELPGRLPSTVVDVSGDRPLILREGAIPAAYIWDELQMKY
ncbi:threonylcarbamoyl-AMP synthase [Candidatus Kaiserbacteria bacterium RIFCSPHIGHO2_12_FULL_53_13]|uniref:L-threonylcarbamoyladenylate synthase n=1 Tax=Candidatus Kaiserbacteria bacterium RIFCSPHIGHO2_12_FULL_53_13 TaxID=1798502 RepID=A0A1F6E6U8_9BACT|nr:MAG: threonylcarbamoyl-AMP synthase [Candidatus Kaiserbacteria bacterium RIFCSPHIGHO2_12_FULL_53_13]OGG74263.1 MAG: threonylcarbamoyl-AMP synthase [Candidatus Kaiserbacteria bacterium RIFCSPLOWO2_01_FULL_52_36]